MRVFSFLFEKAMKWSEHRHAPVYLAGLSFAESSFFPVPPDVMLAPMSLARPKCAWQFALLTTVASVLGGILGYFIGMFAFELIEPLLHSAGYWKEYEEIKGGFAEWGIWIVFLAGFSPIPYKLFTITSGVLGMMFIPFIIASFIGRGARFFLVAGLMVWGGEKMQTTLRQYIDRIGFILVIAMVIAYFIFK